MTLKALTDDLEKRVADVKQLGGAQAIDKQHAANKLTARERVDRLFDKDAAGKSTFVEYMLHAHHQSESPMMAGRKTPADGIITGWGLIDGRKVAVIAYDFTVMAGTIGMIGEMKCARFRDMALKGRMPMIWLLDSAGARVQEAATSMFAGSGSMFYDQVMMSGVIPQIAAMCGPCAAGTAYVPGLADFVPMVRGTSSMSLAGPPLVKAATGVDVTAEELGGSKLHTRESGVADLDVENDDALLAVCREYLSYFPSNCDEPAPRLPVTDPVDREEEAILDTVPANPRSPMDMHKVIQLIVDHGKSLELKPHWGKAVITTLARIGGRPIGIVASNSKWLGGVLTNDPADKAARFIELCDAFNIPLLFLQDTPGFMVGVKTEKEGIIRHGAKMLYAVSRATVPKITVVVRKGYGAGYYVMCGKGYKPDLIVAWPNAEISVMGPEGAVNIAFRKQIEAAGAEHAGDPAAQKAAQDKARADLVEQFRAMISPYIPAAWTHIDDVIDPKKTRKVVHDALVMADGKKVQMPPRKHGVMPV
jgi:acetyl-CoA carboxylase carboxyltransferase component